MDGSIFIIVLMGLQRATERYTATSVGRTGWKSAGRGRIDCHSCAISTSLPPAPIWETQFRCEGKRRMRERASASRSIRGKINADSTSRLVEGDCREADRIVEDNNFFLEQTYARVQRETEKERKNERKKRNCLSKIIFVSFAPLPFNRLTFSFALPYFLFSFRCCFRRRASRLTLNSII